jgi:hypothetical protein
MFGEGLLDQPVFTVDIGDHRLSPNHGRHSGYDLECAIEIEFREVFCAQYGFQPRFELLSQGLQTLSGNINGIVAWHVELMADQTDENGVPRTKALPAYGVVDVKKVPDGRLVP